YPQGSFAQLTQVLTSTGGAWSYVLPTAPKILTQYEAKWNGRTSVVVVVSVRPRITFGYRNGTFRTRVFAATSHAGRLVAIQLLLLRVGGWPAGRAAYRPRPAGRPRRPRARRARRQDRERGRVDAELGRVRRPRLVRAALRRRAGARAFERGRALDDARLSAR